MWASLKKAISGRAAPNILSASAHLQRFPLLSGGGTRGDSPSASEIEKVLQKEGERIIAKIPKGAAVVPLCIEGSEFSSPLLAQKIEQIGMSNSSVAFIIGGSFGLSPQVKQLGKIKLSFGKMTLPHQLARLVLLEQVYRAFSINNNSKYHK